MDTQTVFLCEESSRIDIVNSQDVSVPVIVEKSLKEQKEEAKKAAKEAKAKQIKEDKEAKAKKAKEDKEAAAKKAKEEKEEAAKKTKKPSPKKGKDKKNNNVQEEEDVEEVTVKRFQHKGVLYLKSMHGILYDPESEKEIGTWNEEKGDIDFILMCESYDE